MPFEPEWLYLDEFLALLGPSPDMAIVEFRLCRALEEGILQDRDGTDFRAWHERFEAGKPEFSWPFGVMVALWFDDRRRKYTPRPFRLQLRRAAWLNVFSDLLPGTSQEPSSMATHRPIVDPQTSPAIPEPRSSEEIQRDIGRWYRDEWIPKQSSSDKPPTEPEEIAAAKLQFPSVIKLRDYVRQARKDHAPKDWKKPGARRARRTPPPISQTD